MESLPCFEPVLSVIHDVGLLNFCTDICDWNEELILQFYATLHITGDAEDVNSWVLDWMTENTTTRNQQLNCFVSFLLILPMKVHVASTMTLN